MGIKSQIIPRLFQILLIYSLAITYHIYCTDTRQMSLPSTMILTKLKRCVSVLNCFIISDEIHFIVILHKIYTVFNFLTPNHHPPPYNDTYIFTKPTNNNYYFSSLPTILNFSIAQTPSPM